MNIFDTMKIYAGSWSVKDSRAFSEEEKALVKSAQVVDSEYGLSVCFTMTNGGKTYKPLSNRSTLGIGDSVDLNTAHIVTLSREGDADITRIE